MRNQSLTLLSQLGAFGLLFFAAELAPAGTPPPTAGLFPLEHWHSRVVVEEARAGGVDPALMLAIVAQESAWRADAVSPAGAVGLGQLMPGTARERCGEINLYNPRQNVRCAVKVFAWMVGKCRGDKVCAVAGYNQGIYLTLASGGRPVAKETREYVPRVFDYWRRYSR